MTDGWVFGYGSLVNVATHDHAPARPVRVEGWRRAWRHTTLRPVAFLTAVPDAGAAIDGLAVAVTAAQWLALDAREHAYARVAVARFEGVAGPLQIYAIPDAIPDGRHGVPDLAHPVLLSYLDTVVQGYLRTFGPDGVARFFATTAGWDAPVADDRARPLYPRAQPLGAEERELVDVWLGRLGCRIVAPPVLTA